MFSPLLKITPPACTNSVPTTVLSTALSTCSFIFPRTRGVGTHSPHFTAQEPCSERPTSPVRQQSWDVLVDVSSVSLSPGQPAATEPRFQPPTPTPRPGGQPVAPFRGGAPTPLGCQHPATLLNEWMQPPCPYPSRCPHKPQSLRHGNQRRALRGQRLLGGGGGLLLPSQVGGMAARCRDSGLFLWLKDTCGGNPSDCEYCSHTAEHNGATTATAKLISKVLIA